MPISDLVNLLSDSYVTYEMLVRGQDVDRHTLTSKKSELLSILEAEDRNPDNAAHLSAHFPYATELRDCEELAEDLKRYLPDNAALVDARLKFLVPRMDRIEIPVSDEPSRIRKDNLSKVLDDLRRDISRATVAVDPAFNSTRNSLSTVGNTNPFLSPNVSCVPSSEHRNHVPVWKWDLRFSGDNNSTTATEFLQDVGDYCRSRNVSEAGLLSSISDLFTGSARKWFRTISMTKPFENWKDFVARFLKDFEPAYEREKIMEMIKKRLQRNDENVVKYFVLMEDLFLRLPCVPSEAERVKIIRNNLLPRYVNALALHTFDFVEDLKESCRALEQAGARLQERREGSSQGFPNQNAFRPRRDFPQNNYNPRPQNNWRDQPRRNDYTRPPRPEFNRNTPQQQQRRQYSPPRQPFRDNRNQPNPQLNYLETFPPQHFSNPFRRSSNAINSQPDSNPNLQNFIPQAVDAPMRALNINSTATDRVTQGNIRGTEAPGSAPIPGTSGLNNTNPLQ